MSLDASRLSKAMVAALVAKGAPDNQVLNDFCSTLAQTIITELTAHAEIAGGSLVDHSGKPITGTGGIT